LRRLYLQDIFEHLENVLCILEEIWKIGEKRRKNAHPGLKMVKRKIKRKIS